MNSPELSEAISMVRLSPIQLDSLWFLDFLRYVCSSPQGWMWDWYSSRTFKLGLRCHHSKWIITVVCSHCCSWSYVSISSQPFQSTVERNLSCKVSAREWLFPWNPVFKIIGLPSKHCDMHFLMTWRKDHLNVFGVFVCLYVCFTLQMST